MSVLVSHFFSGHPLPLSALQLVYSVSVLYCLCYSWLCSLGLQPVVSGQDQHARCGLELLYSFVVLITCRSRVSSDTEAVCLAVDIIL